MKIKRSMKYYDKKIAKLREQRKKYRTEKIDITELKLKDWKEGK